MILFLKKVKNMDYLSFENKLLWRKWLLENAKINSGTWLIFNKNTLKASEALKEALCFGWIDGLIKKIDDNNYIKKFTPRQSYSKWSDKNKEFVKELEELGLMTEQGIEAVNNAKRNGQWDKVDNNDITAEEVDKFVNLIKGTEPAYLNLTNMSYSVKSIYAKHYLSAKKDETKRNRLNQIIERLNNNKKPM